MSKTAHVLYGGVAAAKLTETDEGYELRYEKSWLEADGNPPISLTLPLQPEPFRSKVLFAFFDGLIPEGWLLNLVVDNWKLKAADRFALLLMACRDTIGAVTVEPQTKSR